MKIFDFEDNELLELTPDDSSVRYRSVMQENSLTLNFSRVEPVSVPVGSYCEFEGQRYTLFYPENFKKHNTRNFEYTLVLHGNQEALKLYKFKDLSAKPYRLKFPLTATPEVFLQLLVDNMNEHDTGWSAGDCIEADDKLISFNHEYCYDVLNRIAQEFNTEWEVENKTIHLRKVEKFKDDPLALSYGKGNGFKSGVGRQNEGDKQPVGRLYAQGGERNIDYSQYGSSTLLLPKSATLVQDGKTYRTDADGMYITRDGNNNPAEDSYDANHVYPKRVGTVSDVIVVDEEDNLYDIIDSSIPESLNYGDCRIAGEKATIVFQSGALAGREFDIQQTDNALTGYDHEERKFQIVPQELDGYVMPGGVFVPKTGDKYAIFNISMPQAYISDDTTQGGASWDMFREAVRYFAENEEPRFSFRGELDGVWSKSKWLQIGAKIVPGGYVLFSDTQFQPEGVKVRITSIKDYVNMPHKPEITLSNAPISMSFASDLGKLEAEEVVRESDKKEIIRYTKRQWRDTLETMSLLEKSLLHFDKGINPITVQTMQMLVGDESLQFRFVNNKTNPQVVTHNVTFNSENKTLNAPAGIIQHMTMGINTLKKNHEASEYKFWNVTQYVSPALDPDEPYYLYARVLRTGTTGQFLLSKTSIKMDAESNAYHLLVGILNSEFEGERSFVTLYGFTEILPGRVTTDKIVSQDGQTYFDLVTGTISGRIRFINENNQEQDIETVRLFIQYSASGTSWHDTFQNGDIYMRQKNGVSGQWSAAMRITGADGNPGASSYTHIRYSQNPDGNPMTSLPTNAKYIGIAVTNSATAPTSYTAYSWSLIKGADGNPGGDGDGFAIRYMRANNRPAKPPAGVLNPAGWMPEIDNPVNNDIYWPAFVGGWEKQTNGEYKSETIGHNENSPFRLNFYNRTANSELKITVRTSSESSDKLHVGKLDESLGENYSNARLSFGGTQSQEVIYQLTTAGEHFILFDYKKDGSVSSGSDAAYVKIEFPIQSVWMTIANVVNGVVGAWSEPALFIDHRIEETIAATDRSKAITDKFGTTIDGALINTAMMLLREADTQTVTAGISGIQGINRNHPAFWAGGTAGEAVALIEYLHKVRNGITPDLDEYTDLAPVTFLHDGSAKLGAFLVEQSGRIVMVDPATAKPRLVFDVTDLDNINDLVDGATDSGTVTVSAGNASSSPLLSSYEQTLTPYQTLPQDTLFVFNGTTLTLTAEGKAQAGGLASRVSVSLFLSRSYSPYIYLGSWEEFFAGTNYVSKTQSFNVSNKSENLPAGVYSVVMRVDAYGDVSSSNLKSTATSYNWSWTLANVRYFQFGKNGQGAFFSNNHWWFTENDGLDVRGKINIPGVLASGTVNTNGGITNGWGAKLDGTGTTISGGYRIYLKEMKHNQYSVQVTPHTGTSAFRVSTKTTTYFDILGTGNADFVVFGRNY